MNAKDVDDVFIYTGYHQWKSHFPSISTQIYNVCQLNRNAAIVFLGKTFIDELLKIVT